MAKLDVAKFNNDIIDTIVYFATDGNEHELLGAVVWEDGKLFVNFEALTYHIIPSDKENGDFEELKSISFMQEQTDYFFLSYETKHETKKIQYVSFWYAKLFCEFHDLKDVYNALEKIERETIKYMFHFQNDLTAN